MKIIGIAGSPRGAKSQTLRLLKAILDGAQKAGAEVELVDVCQLKIEYCKACDTCHRTGKCVHKDDFAALRAKMMAAEGVVLASPNYFRTVTAQMKTVIDRMADVIHCQLFVGKYACSASTAGGPACEEVTSYLNQILLTFGASVVGSVAVSVGAGTEGLPEAEKKAAAVGRELAEAIASKRVYADQQESHQRTAAYFKRLVELNKARWPYEYDLWAKAPAKS
jgi:multimeric flavodoxin WrbA